MFDPNKTLDMRVVAWLTSHPEWTRGEHHGRATLTRRFDFPDDFATGRFSRKMTDLVAYEWGLDLHTTESGTEIRMTIVFDEDALNDGSFQLATECDAAFDGVIRASEEEEDDDEDP